MNQIWANRLVAGTKKWEEMPSARQSGVKAVLAERVKNGAITIEQYEAITSEEYAAEQ